MPTPRALTTVAAAVLALASLACGAGQTDKPNGPPADAPTSASAATKGRPAKGHTIKFEVVAESGTATMVNWSTLEDHALLNNVQTPWTKEARLEDKYGLVGVNATADGRITCKLWVDGKLVDEGESDGSVNCSDTVS